MHMIIAGIRIEVGVKLKAWDGRSILKSWMSAFKKWGVLCSQ